jgi:hypothetical protein
MGPQTTTDSINWGLERSADDNDASTRGSILALAWGLVQREAPLWRAYIPNIMNMSQVLLQLCFLDATLSSLRLLREEIH